VTFFAFIIAVLNIVVITALGAITSILYNFSVRLTGGLLVGFTSNSPPLRRLRSSPAVSRWPR
jgi:hypothetical protein